MDTKSIIEKIADTISIITPIVGLVLVGLGLSGIVPEINKWSSIILEALIAVSTILQIWGIKATAKLKLKKTL